MEWLSHPAPMLPPDIGSGDGASIEIAKKGVTHKTRRIGRLGSDRQGFRFLRKTLKQLVARASSILAEKKRTTAKPSETRKVKYSSNILDAMVSKKGVSIEKHSPEWNGTRFGCQVELHSPPKTYILQAMRPSQRDRREMQPI